jgi:hypothetical protein
MAHARRSMLEAKPLPRLLATEVSKLLEAYSQAVRGDR